MDHQPNWQKQDALMADILGIIGAPSIGERSDERLESHQNQRSNSGYKLPDMPTAELSWDTPNAREREKELEKSYIEPIELSRVQVIYIGMTAHVVEWLQKECRNTGLSDTNIASNPADLGGADIAAFSRHILDSSIKIPDGIQRHWKYSIERRTYHLRYLRARLESWDTRDSADIERHQQFVDALSTAYSDIFENERRNREGLNGEN